MVPVLAQSKGGAGLWPPRIAPSAATGASRGGRDRPCMAKAMAMPWDWHLFGAVVHDRGIPWLMKTEATDPTSDFTRRRCAARSRGGMPRPPPRNARATGGLLRSHAGKDHLLVAGSPSRVPGILMKTLGRAARAWNSLVAAGVLAASWANKGDTSQETQPSTLGLLPMGRNMSAARRDSSSGEFEEQGFG